MQRLPGQDDELSIDEEAGTAALIGAGRPARWRARGGLAAAAAALGLAGLALAWQVTPRHLVAAAAGGGHPRLDGQKGARFTSLDEEGHDKGTLISKAVSPGDTTVWVQNTDIFAKGDEIVLVNTADDNSENVPATVKSISEGNITLTKAVQQSFPEFSFVVVPADQASVNKQAHTESSSGETHVAADKAPPHGSSDRDGGGGGGQAVKVVLFLLVFVCICAVGAFLFIKKPDETRAFVSGVKDSLNDAAGRARARVEKLYAPAPVVPQQEPGVQTTEWIFKPDDRRAVELLTAPNFDCEVAGPQLQPRERFRVSEIVEHESNVLFLRLADGRGWCVDRETGHEMCYELDQEVNELWKYQPANGLPIYLREGPYIEGPKTGETLKPGEKFNVDRIQAGDHNALFLRLAGGRGWVFDEKHDKNGDTPDGTLCKRALDELWTYVPTNGKPIGIRKGPNYNTAAKTSFTMYPREIFRVDEIEAGEGADDGVLFLSLADGRGWLFDRHPQDGDLCQRVFQEPRPDGVVATTATRPVEATKIRVQSVEDFKVGGAVEIHSAKGTEKGKIKEIVALESTIVLTSKMKYKHPLGASVTSK